MKVLFAVSNEEISESIVKKYQKLYKQIISYKNVYYFNAILKELQKDKTYDRIVISEDLEAFTHTQYEQIDKFIFEKLDSISDEASDVRGNDTPIILICSDRRTKSEQMLVKLFGIGIYNAIIGNDRSVDEVCRLINRPRLKKEAKAYYKIDSEEVNYQAENENDVSEMEIQNILAHYKRLGKNEERYVDSFNNIAAQYNDTQLRIISKFLPLNVRAVLEEKSPKYQEIMSFNNSVSNDLRTKERAKNNEGPSEILLKTNDQKENIMSRPVVIPSAVNSNGVKRLSKPKIVHQQPEILQRPVEQQSERNPKTVEQPMVYNRDEQVRNTNTQEDYLNKNNIQPQIQENEKENNIEETVEQVKRGRGRPRKTPVVEETTNVQTVKRGRGRPRKNPIPDSSVEEPTMLPGFEEEKEETQNILPGVEKKEEENFLPGFDEQQEENILPGLEDYDNNSVKEEPTMLPGFEEQEEPINTLPGVEEDISEEDNFLPGINGYNSNENTEQNRTEDIVETNQNYNNNDNYNNEYNNNYNNNNYYNIYNNNAEYDNSYENSMDLSSILTPGKKVISFVGTSKNGTSFIVNNLATLMSSMGVNTAILDTTQNRNSYYIYTKNEEQKRKMATKSIEGLVNGSIANGIEENQNLTVYTALPNENGEIANVDKILETLIKNYSLILIDTDFNTPKGYFKQSQEIYLVQTMDVLTIQPLTAFLRDLKAKNILDENKLRIILNKYVKIKGVREETIIGGMAFYNDPSMSFMTELFNRNKIKYVSIPFETETYVKYLEGVIECEVSLRGYSKMFLQTLKQLGNMVYPMSGEVRTNTNYRPPSVGGTNFSANMNNTLDKMKRSL